MRAAHICEFQSAPGVKASIRYEDLKAAVLVAGRFSVFEATESARAARLFTQLCEDSEVETFPLGFPWMGVRPRVVQAAKEGR